MFTCCNSNHPSITQCGQSSMKVCFKHDAIHPHTELMKDNKKMPKDEKAVKTGAKSHLRKWKVFQLELTICNYDGVSSFTIDKLFLEKIIFF